jgi:protein-tyrosine phosphatase
MSHFWHMVYHETKDIAVVVMLTQTSESGREKCSQYFPTDLENPTMEVCLESTNPSMTDGSEDSVNDCLVGRITLVESEYDPLCRSEVRRFELTMGGEPKTVQHYLFSGWADYAKPEGEDRKALLHLIKQTASKTSAENPRIVHCSAGVGRTGTFIALDHLLRELDSGKLLQTHADDADPIFETVNQLREQRMMMVFNELQLHFIYEVLAEQARDRLEPQTADADGSAPRSPKITRLSSNLELQLAPKPPLEPVAAVAVTTPTRSWSGTPEVSETE